MSDAEHKIIVDGLGAAAVGGFEMGCDRDRVREYLLDFWNQFDRESGDFREAAAAISSFPQPLVESADETERMRPIREMLGVQSADVQLTAALDGHELLEELAAEYE